MGSLGQNPKSERVLLIERVQKLEESLRAVLPVAEIGASRLETILKICIEDARTGAIDLSPGARMALDQAERDIAVARELVGQ